MIIASLAQSYTMSVKTIGAQRTYTPRPADTRSFTSHRDPNRVPPCKILNQSILRLKDNVHMKGGVYTSKVLAIIVYGTHSFL